MGKTLFITDLDGTLLNKDAEITWFTAEIINNLIDEGMIFTYATARSIVTASKVTRAINFKYPAAHHNGGNEKDPKTGEYLDKRIFDKDIVSDFILKFRDNGIYPLVYAFIDGMERVSWIEGKETGGIKFFLDNRKGDKRLRPVKDYGYFFDGDIYNMIFIGMPEELREITAFLNSNPHFSHHIFTDAYSDTYWLEITRFDATKDFGARKVKELVNADKIICFGDNINDIPMFNISDEKYAVENAVDELKNIATDIIGSNNNDGVAKWLEKNARNYF